MSERTRREVVLSGVALGAGLLAGCTGTTDAPANAPTATDEPSPTPSPTSTPSPTATATPEPAVTAIQFSSGEGSCGSTASAEVTDTDEGFRATGAIVAPTPCYGAELAGRRVDEGEVRFRIETREPSGTPACVQCIATIPFELTATTRGSFETVVLDLGGNDPKTIRKDLS